MLACNEPGGYRMPVLKQVFKLSANKASRYPSSKETERQRILHFVFEDARRRAVGLKSVCMFPIGEWSGNLEIAEIAAWFVLLMHGDPMRKGHRPNRITTLAPRSIPPVLSSISMCSPGGVSRSSASGKACHAYRSAAGASIRERRTKISVFMMSLPEIAGN